MPSQTDTPPGQHAAHAAAPPRPDNWPALLDAFLQTRQNSPFDWAANNCCLFAADWVHALTGIDPAKAHRGTVKTEEQAGAFLAKKGGVLGLIKRAAKTHGWEEVPPAYAQRGDIILYDGPQGDTLGVCAGATYAAAAPKGLAYYDMTHALRAWRIS